jgi:hypothetical protein
VGVAGIAALAAEALGRGEEAHFFIVADSRAVEVGAESKCYPFFDFHIDVEREGKLLCLGLTGAEGIKAFIHGESGAEKMR